MKIFIDQGHNPSNPNAGAEGNGVREQDVTYAVGIRLAELLSANPFFDVRLSRNTPTEILGTSNSTSLAARVDAANSWGANYFISLHCNYSENTAASGSEVYIYSESSPAWSLGVDILNGLHDYTGLPNRGMMTDPLLYVLRWTEMPALLVEMGYLSNAGDAALLSLDPLGFAKGIYSGMISFFGLD
ncbi:MAG: N-acetylmuramoyl-L-alanine amidase [Clostridiales bacterium]|nr:N-acetylmuramoyl-L-alanine amidase [Clostridiales bacterium]